MSSFEEYLERLRELNERDQRRRRESDRENNGFGF
jgi:hypothetical protein